MTTFRILPGSIRHVRPMSQRMRAAACVAIEGYGYDPREALHRVFMASVYSRTAMIDGKPAAMWGVVGSLLGDEGQVWLVLSEKIGVLPLSMIRLARQELALFMEDHETLSATFLPDDAASVRFAQLIGFQQRPDVEKIPVGDSYIVPMDYWPEGRC